MDYLEIGADYEVKVIFLDGTKVQGLGVQYQKAVITFLTILLRQDAVLTEFDESLWMTVIDRVIIKGADDIQFIFRDGTMITV